MLGKIKKAALTKLPVERSKIKGKRLFIDFSSPSTVNMGSKKHWMLVLQDSTNHTWSYFLKQKSELVDMMIVLLKDLKMDNTGEIESFERWCKQEEMGIVYHAMHTTME